MTMPLIESPLRIEPCGLEEDVDPKLVGLADDLRAAAARLGAGLDPDRLDAFRRQVRLANARASNRIEGIDATADEIAAALNGQPVPARRLAAAQAGAAHVEVEAWIDGLAVSGALPSPTSAAFIAEIHARLYRAMPEELQMAGAAAVVPGALRGPGEDVAVGRHLPPSGGRIEAFLEHFERRYRGLTSGALGRILAIPAAHHRLAYIHPFIDGNGRVGRLMSHAMLHEAGLYGHGSGRSHSRSQRARGWRVTCAGWRRPTARAAAIGTGGAT